MKTLKKLCLEFDGVHLSFTSSRKLFPQIVKLQALESLEIEFVNIYGLPSFGPRAFENILKKLPSSVIKKCVFQKADFRADENDYSDDRETEHSEKNFGDLQEGSKDGKEPRDSRLQVV